MTFSILMVWSEIIFVVKKMKIYGDLYRYRTDIIGFLNGILLEIRKNFVDVQNTYTDNYTDYLDTSPQLFYYNACDYVYNLMKENAKDIPNCDLYEKGFLATSLVKGQELNYKIKLRIYVPAGSKCVYQGNVNNEQEFYEVDIMHDSKLKIESIDSEYINCKLLGTA